MNNVHEREGRTWHFWLAVSGFVMVMLASPLCSARAEFFSIPKVDKNHFYSLSSAQDSMSVTNYRDVSLSEINPEIGGVLGDAKIKIPITGIVDGVGLVYIPEIDGQLNVNQLSNDEVWLDSKQKFTTSDKDGNDVYLEEFFKGQETVENFKIKNGKFQGSKKNQLAILNWSSSDGTGEYMMLIYDDITESVIMIGLEVSNESRGVGEKIWKTVLKSATDKAKKTSKKKSGSSGVGELESKAYSNANFSIQFPKGWAVSTDEEGTVALPKNLGASIVIVSSESEEPIDYDPDMIDFWVSIFKKEYKTELDGFKFKSARNVSVDGTSALRFDYTARVDGIPIIGYQLIILSDGFQHILTATYMDKTQEGKYSSIVDKSFATYKRSNR